MEPLGSYSDPPTDRGTNTQRVAYDLGPVRSERLKAIAGQAGIFSLTFDQTLLNIFVAILSAYLHRISGNTTISICMLFHNRPSSALQETIGSPKDMRPLRIEVSEEDTFVSLVNKAIEETRETLQHSQYTTDSLLNDRDYDVVLNYLKTSRTDFARAPGSASTAPPPPGARSLSLQVYDFEDTGSLVLDFSFNLDVFDAQKQRWTIDHFNRILEGFLENPSQAITAVRLLEGEEKRRVLEEFNRAEAPYPADRSIVDRFEAQVERSPDLAAVEFKGESLTYRELNARANQVESYLRRLGVARRELVGLCFERSLDMIAALLGVLKSGAAYVPLDPADPKDRLAFMLDDAAILVLLTQSRLEHSLPETAARMLFLDTEWETIGRESTDNIGLGPAPDDVAYAIYTSGSTGKPKGVLVEHRSVFEPVESQEVV